LRPFLRFLAAAPGARRGPRRGAWHGAALAALGGALAWGPVHSQDHGAHGSHGASTAAATPASTAADSQELSEGEVTRWDPRTRKVTLRHGELKNLDMPPMTMVFTLQDAGGAEHIAVGRKVRFRAEQVNGAFVITRLEPSP